MPHSAHRSCGRLADKNKREKGGTIPVAALVKRSGFLRRFICTRQEIAKAMGTSYDWHQLCTNFSLLSKVCGREGPSAYASLCVEHISERFEEMGLGLCNLQAEFASSVGKRGQPNDMLKSPTESE